MPNINVIEERMKVVGENTIKHSKFPGWSQDLSKEIREALKEHLCFTYRHEKCAINPDAIEIDFLYDDGDDPIRKKIKLVYKNLYTFVLVQGICVPYYKWTFTDEFIDHKNGYHFKRFGDKYIKHQINKKPKEPDDDNSTYSMMANKSMHFQGQALDFHFKVKTTPVRFANGIVHVPYYE